MGKIRTRFAPSPTGFLHIGGLRTALYAYALAKHSSGDFILRIEDTDQKRQVEGATEALQKTLKRFNLNWDEFYIQSERHKTGIYKKAGEKLVAEGHAFYCQCQAKNAKEDGFSSNLRDPCRDKGFTLGAIKLKVPDGKNVSYYDFVHKKEISWNTNDVYDATLLKSDGFPTYHLAAMVDDLDMGITHILRGHDWLPSTPIHLLVLEYLASGPEGLWPGRLIKVPEIGHLTDILSAETGKKLSKRRDSVFVEQFLDEGYLPDALLNFVMLLGWAPKDNRELFTLSEFVEAFDIKGFQEANPRFLRDKLDWMNGEYIRKLSDDEFISLTKNHLSHYDISIYRSAVPLIKDRIKKLKDVEIYAGFFFKSPEVDTKLFGEDYKDHLKNAIEVFENIEDWNLEKLGISLLELCDKKKFSRGNFFMTLRIAITGSKFTPPINDSMIILGKDETLKRLKSVL